jgi:hypothetical protein
MDFSINSDATTLVNVTNDFGNNWRNQRSTENSIKSGGQSAQIVDGAENLRCHDNQHISCFVLPKVENSVISVVSTGQTGRPSLSTKTSIKTESDGPLNGGVTSCLCQRVPKLVREPAGDGHEITDKWIPMKLVEREVMVGVTLKGNQKKLKKLQEFALVVMRGCKWISNLDLNKGYYQVEIRDEHRPKITVVTIDGSLKINIMGIGLVGVVAIKQNHFKEKIHFPES